VGWIFVPLADVQDDPESIVARLLEVAGEDDDDQDEKMPQQA
jgi:hypothetical protein